MYGGDHGRVTDGGMVEMGVLGIMSVIVVFI